MSIYISKFSHDKKFYVYEYLRLNKSMHGNVGTPYYVGKGTRKRLYEKHQKGISVPNETERILIVANNMNEADAFQLEMLLIYLYGRIDLGTGCLRNKTFGGDGTFGLLVTQEAKRKQSLAKLGTKHSEATKKKMADTRKGEKNTFFGKSHSDQSKKMISKNNGKGQAKVTPDQVREIRRLYAETDMTQRQIGQIFHIAESTTNQIIVKRWWKDID